MAPSMDVSARPTFSQIAQQFRGVGSDNHLRLKSSDDGSKTLYVHKNGISLTGHGMRTKQEEVMQRRDEATKMVLDAFKEQYKAYPTLVQRVLQHVMDDDSFDKPHTQLQLRGSDIGRLEDMMIAEITAQGHLNTEISNVVSDYSPGILREATIRGSGGTTTQNMPLVGGMDQRQIHDGFSQALKSVVSEKSGEALLDRHVQSMFSGGTENFMQALARNSDVMCTRSLMEAPGLAPLRPLLGAALAIGDWRHPISKGDNFTLALSLGTGQPLSPRPEPGPLDTLEQRRMAPFTQDNWAANELRGRFFGEDNPLGMPQDKLTTLNKGLDEIDRKISDLQSKLAGTTNKGEREDIALALQSLSNAKISMIQGAIESCVTAMLFERNNSGANELRNRFFGENPTNIPDVFKPLHDRLNELDRRIDDLQSRLAGDLSPGERKELTSQLLRAASDKLTAMETAIREWAPELSSEFPSNPITDALGPMTDSEGMMRATKRQHELDQMLGSIDRGMQRA